MSSALLGLRHAANAGTNCGQLPHWREKAEDWHAIASLETATTTMSFGNLDALPAAI
jgi:hypothetical protein